MKLCAFVYVRVVSREKNRVLLTDTPGLTGSIVPIEFDYGDTRWENKKLTKV